MAPRPVCSDAERRFAVACHDALRAAGHEAWVETHWIRPQHAAGIALAAALTAIAGLVALGAPVVGLVAAAIGAVCLALEAAHRAVPAPAAAAAPGDPGRARRAGARAGRSTCCSRRGPTSRGAAGRSGSRGSAAGSGGSSPPRCSSRPRARRASPAPTGRCSARSSSSRPSCCSRPSRPPGTRASRGAATARRRPRRSTPRARAYAALVADPPPGVAAGLLLGAPDARRAHLRRERLPARRTALLIVRDGPVRSRHRQWRAAADAAGLPARRGGPGGLPAAEAPPAAAEPLARALATTL